MNVIRRNLNKDVLVKLSDCYPISNLPKQSLRFFPYGMLKLANGKVSEKVKSESPIFGFKEHVTSQNGTSQLGNNLVEIDHLLLDTRIK